MKVNDGRSSGGATLEVGSEPKLLVQVQYFAMPSLLVQPR